MVMSEWPLHPGHPVTLSVAFSPLQDIVLGTQLTAKVFIQNMQVGML